MSNSILFIYLVDGGQRVTWDSGDDNNDMDPLPLVPVIGYFVLC